MKKQLSLVLSFAARPALILLDEPTDGIDAVTRHDVLQLMVDEVAERDTSILITSHRLEDIERMCNRIGFLEDNRLTNVMDLDELKKNTSKFKWRLMKMSIWRSESKTFRCLIRPVCFTRC